MKYSIYSLDLNTLDIERIASAASKLSALAFVDVLKTLARRCAPSLEFYIVNSKED